MIVFVSALRRIIKQPMNLLLIVLFPALFAVLISISTDIGVEGDADDVTMYFGVVDLDGTVVSKTLARQLGMRYNVIELGEEDISGKLTEQDVPWVLLIREGYERDVLAGHEPVLEGYSLTVSDVSSLGAVTAENITRSLILLGTNDEQVLSAWEEASRVEVRTLETGSNWGLIAFWFGFFGFISMYTAHFIVKTLMDDKRGGMPDRIGVLPMTPRRHLAQGVLAAFAATEVTVALTIMVIGLFLGEVPNAPFMFMMLSAFNLFAVAFVVAVYSLARSNAIVSIIVTMFTVIMSMLGGLFWPLEFMPEFMQRLAWFSPGYWLMRGLNSIHTITFEGFGMPILFLLAFTLVAILLGGWKRIQALED